MAVIIKWLSQRHSVCRRYAENSPISEFIIFPGLPSCLMDQEKDTASSQLKTGCLASLPSHPSLSRCLNSDHAYLSCRRQRFDSQAGTGGTGKPPRTPAAAAQPLLPLESMTPRGHIPAQLQRPPQRWGSTRLRVPLGRQCPELLPFFLFDFLIIII